MSPPLSHDNDVASQAMGLLSFLGSWLLARHQWVVHGMRNLVTGEALPAEHTLPSFGSLPHDNLNLPEALRQGFIDESQRLDILWLEVIQAAQPIPALPLFQQLDHFQRHADRFMREAERASQTLWHDLALRDPLTGARTRLTLGATLYKKQQEYARSLPSCIVLFDQNDFKTINDRWGHAVGDTVLAMTAQLIQQLLRPGDVLFRYGGDEWLVILTNAGFSQGTDIAARVREQVRRHAFVAPDGQTFHTDLSYGVAEARDHETQDAWIARADLALYAMKHSRCALSTAASEY